MKENTSQAKLAKISGVMETTLRKNIRLLLNMLENPEAKN